MPKTGSGKTPLGRYDAIRRVGELIHAQTLDENNIVISETYKYDGKSHLFVLSTFFPKAWCDVEDSDLLITIRNYLQMRVRRNLSEHPLLRQWLGIRFKRWRHRKRYYEVKHELEETENIAVPER